MLWRWPNKLRFKCKSGLCLEAIVRSSLISGQSMIGRVAGTYRPIADIRNNKKPLQRVAL